MNVRRLSTVVFAIATILFMAGDARLGGATAAEPEGAAVQRRVTTGWQHSCLHDVDNTVQCWSVAGATEVPAGEYLKVAGGAYHACAITIGGDPVCWGNNTWMESTPPVSGSFKDVSADYYHSCLLALDGTATCWGLNPYGETNVPAGMLFDQISIGSEHACGLKIDQSAVCWGLDDFGQSAEKPGPFTYVGAGNQFSCGLKEDGGIQCWGRGDFGQTDSPAGTFSQIDVGGTGSCGIRTPEGTIACWGSNVSGENIPPDQDATYTDISRSGQYHACAVRTEGSIVCWGVRGNAPVPNIRPATLPDGNTGAAYSAMLSGPPLPYGDDDGEGLPPYTFQVWNGALPDGLTLEPDGDIVGTPTAAGSFAFEVRMDDARYFTAYKEYTIEIGEAVLLWGDSDCDLLITTRDNQSLLRNVLQQNPLSQTEPCPDLGSALPASAAPRTWGDWDCDGLVTTRDNQALLRRVLEQNPLSQTEPCPDIGTPA